MQSETAPEAGFSRLRHPFAVSPDARLGHTSAENVAACRQILVLAVFMIFGFWGVYRITDPGHFDPLWARVAFALVPAGLALGSYLVATVRSHMITLWRVFLYVTVAWITALTSLNGFDSGYAIGLLFVVAATSAGFGIGVRRRGPPFLFLVWSTLLPSVAVWTASAPGVERPVFLISLVSLAVIFYLILDWRIRTEDALRARRQEAEAASRLKSTIMGNLNHEFRTPLTSILGFSESLQESLSGTEQEQARLIHQSGSRLQRTLDTLIALSRLRADRAHLEPETIDVAEHVEEAVAPFRRKAKSEDLELEVEYPDRSIQARLNPEAVRRIVMVLTDNAIKFTDDGHVVVRVEEAGDEIVLGVTDTGMGITEDAQDLLFEPFRQVSEGINRTEEGLGLGLTLVGQLVGLMDGSVEVESEPGIGTRVEVRLPLHEEVGPVRDSEDAEVWPRAA